MSYFREATAQEKSGWTNEQHTLYLAVHANELSRIAAARGDTKTADIMSQETTRLLLVAGKFYA